ncbi:MAG: alpha/beta hydrolase [Gammaproteobacteria bacterium]|nr:alpha/beta hydrolase [Gammaproteobacteria bacterium]
MTNDKQQIHSKHARNYLFALKAMRKLFAVLQFLSPRLTGRFAAWLWFRPASQSRIRKKQLIFDQADKHQFQINGKNIVCHCWGSTGPVILLVHGWSGNARQFSAFIVPLLKDNFQILALDAPAHGESSGKKTNALEIAEAIQQLENEKGPFYAVITHSFGMMCAFRAIQSGVNFNRLIAISPPSNGLGLLQKFGDTFSLKEPALATMRKQIERHFNKQVWQLLDLESPSNSIELPALIIHDKDDYDVPCDEGKALASNWSNAQIHITQGLGHRRILRTEQVIDLCTHFLTSKIQGISEDD